MQRYTAGEGIARTLHNGSTVCQFVLYFTMGKQLFSLSSYVEVVEVCAAIVRASVLYYEGTMSRINQEEVWQIKIACASVQRKAASMIAKAAKSPDLQAAFKFSMEESLAIARFIFPIIRHNPVAIYCRDKSHYLSDERHSPLTWDEHYSFESSGISHSTTVVDVAAEVED
jgi:hypothetical protein